MNNVYIEQRTRLLNAFTATLCIFQDKPKTKFAIEKIDDGIMIFFGRQSKRVSDDRKRIKKETDKAIKALKDFAYSHYTTKEIENFLEELKT